jgi:TetR/AcrR family transcriptional repressor of nem operon
MPWEKQFDRDEVLNRAKLAFWAGGYEGVSLEKLLGSMGIQKGSFYATFGSKHEVLLESLRRYVSERFTEFDGLAATYPPLEALRQHLDIVLAESNGVAGSYGCFLVNASLELAPKDEQVRKITTKALKFHEGFYQRLFEAARQRGDVEKSFDVAGKSSALLGMVLGMRVMSRAGMPRAALRTLHEQALSLARGE